MTRSEMYALVWQLPVHRLAPLLGLSDKGLSKLCHRHDIPVPNRGHWMRVAAGQAVAPTPLPARANDETIPRFRTLDGSGAPLEGPAAVQWVIPGVPRASPGELPAVDADGLRAALADAAATPGAAPRKKRTPPPAQTVPSRSPAQRQPVAHVDSADLKVPGADSIASARLAAPLDARAVALQAELERAFAAAADHQRHLATLQLLNAVAMRAMDAEPAAAQSILGWVSAMRRGLEADDPVARLVSVLRRGARRGIERVVARRMIETTAPASSWNLAYIKVASFGSRHDERHLDAPHDRTSKAPVRRLSMS